MGENDMRCPTDGTFHDCGCCTENPRLHAEVERLHGIRNAHEGCGIHIERLERERDEALAQVSKAELGGQILQEWYERCQREREALQHIVDSLAPLQERLRDHPLRGDSDSLVETAVKVVERLQLAEAGVLPRKGALAFCGLNTLGWITSDSPVLVTYKDGNTGMAWTGIHLTDAIAPIGSPWSSRNPRVVGYMPSESRVLEEMVRRLQRAEAVVEAVQALERDPASPKHNHNAVPLLPSIMAACPRCQLFERRDKALAAWEEGKA